MKRALIGTILITVLFYLVNVNAQKKSSPVIVFDDVTNLNFTLKTEKYNIEKIKKICTFDYCDFVRGSTKVESIEIFTNSYLKTLEPEVAANLKVKGIKITSIELLT